MPQPRKISDRLALCDDDNLIGSPEQIVRGLTRQVAGKAQKGRGDVKQKIKGFNKAHPR